MKFSTALPWILIVIVVIGFGSYMATQRAPSAAPTARTVTSAQPASTVERVDVILDFIPSGVQTVDYVGIDQGFFAKYGLQVNVIPNPQGSAGAIRALAGRKVDFATFADVGTLVVLMAKENITNVRAIATQYVKNPMGIEFLEGKDRPPIKTPKDLEGKTVGSFLGNSEEAMFPAFCKANNIDCSKVNIQHASPATLNSGLLSGKFDAVLLYNRNVADLQPEASKAGLTVGNFPYAQYGVDIYANMVTTRTDLINSNPNMINRFLQALEEASQYAVAHPDSAAGSVVKFNPQLNLNVTRGEWGITAQLMGGSAIVNAKDPLMNGWIDPTRMKATITTVSAAYTIHAPDPSEVYTDQFVKAP